MRRHPRGARVDVNNLQAWGTCDACGFIYNLINLKEREDWRGTRTNQRGYFVCDKCLDEPQRQLGTIILPPDPVSVKNARPEPYTQDETDYLSTQDDAILIDQDGDALTDQGG